MSKNEKESETGARLGEAKTIARAATLASDTSDALAALAAGDTLSDSGTRPAPISASATLDDSGPRYQRTTLLGEGGMGQVWQVGDSRVGRRVAMKLMRSTDANDVGARARFLREARVQGQLEHPAVVPVYDLGTSDEGEIYFTMKRVRGVTLADVIARLARGEMETIERYSLRRLLTAFSQVCLAVEFAHARGVLHRDLKPENLMLGNHGEVYVLDWGVARILRDAIEEGGTLTDEQLRELASANTKTGLVGTPGYIAPEQLRGKPIGAEADVYALGAILFELLAHEPLAQGKSSLAVLEETMSGIDAAARLADGNHPPELVALCARATQLDPDQRPPTARAIHDAIERFLDGERDLQLRRELAERHLAMARDAIASQGDDLAAHKTALRETGRALGILPEHPDARRLILELFARMPKETPPEVEASIEAERAHQSRITARSGTTGMASMLLFLPILFLLGVRNWLGIAVFMSMTVCAVGISAFAAVQKRRSSGLLYLLVFFNNLVFALCSGMYGPLVLVPAMVITNTISFVLHMDGWPRRFAIVSGCVAIALPVLLAWAGLIPSSYMQSGDGILLRPLWLSFPPMWTIVFLTASTLIAVVNGARNVGEVREALTQAERRNHMQRWQLSQLLPEDAGDAPARPFRRNTAAVPGSR